MKLLSAMLSLILVSGIINYNAGEEAKDNKQICYRWVNSYFRRDGTYVSGYYRDTSNDGDPYNNANYLGSDLWK